VTPFYACATGHDEVRWSFMAPAGNRCWYCGGEGDQSRSTYILETSTLSTPDHVFDDAVRV
jgi:hypothetical protein